MINFFSKKALTRLGYGGIDHNERRKLDPFLVRHPGVPFRFFSKGHPCVGEVAVREVVDRQAGPWGGIRWIPPIRQAADGSACVTDPGGLQHLTVFDIVTGPARLAPPPCSLTTSRSA